MYYAQKNLGQITLEAQNVDPRRPWDYTLEDTQQFQVAMPLWGPWYQSNPYLGPESYFNPVAPGGVIYNPFLPRWTGSFIQPRNVDPLVLVEGVPGIDDPTGGDYWSSSGPLGPGEDIGVASRWAGELRPRGFAATTL